MGYQVFISHASQDMPVARELIGALEARGITHFFAPDSIKGGDDYLAKLNEAVRNSEIVVLLLSKYANESTFVGREIAMASRYGIPVYPIKIENVEYSPSLEILLVGTQHFLAFPAPFGPFFKEAAEDLREKLDFIEIEKKKESEAGPEQKPERVAPPPPPPPPEPWWKKLLKWVTSEQALAIAAVGATAVVVVGFVSLLYGGLTATPELTPFDHPVPNAPKLTRDQVLSQVTEECIIVLVSSKTDRIAIKPVTRSQFEAYADDPAGGGQDNGKMGPYPYDWSNPGRAQIGDDGVVCVSWNDAQHFCNWLNGGKKGPFHIPDAAKWGEAWKQRDLNRWQSMDEIKYEWVDGGSPEIAPLVNEGGKTSLTLYPLSAGRSITNVGFRVGYDSAR